MLFVQATKHSSDSFINNMPSQDISSKPPIIQSNLIKRPNLTQETELKKYSNSIDQTQNIFVNEVDAKRKNRASYERLAKLLKERYASFAIDGIRATYIYARILKIDSTRTSELTIDVSETGKNQQITRRNRLHYRKEGYALKYMEKHNKFNAILFLAVSLQKKDSYLVVCDLEQFTEIKLPTPADSPNSPYNVIQKINNDTIQLRNAKKIVIELQIELCVENIFELDEVDEGAHFNLRLPEEIRNKENDSNKVSYAPLNR